jgi:L-fuconolactonase
MPDFPITDTHVHLYDPAAVKFDWMKDVPMLNKPHLPADYNRLTAGVEIETIVFVEVDAAAGHHMAESDWVANLSKSEPRLKGMVASMPLEKGPAAVERDIERFANVPIARAVRRLIQGHADEPGWCLRDPFVQAVQLLPKYNLSFDLCIFHPQMADVIALAKRCSNVRFVLDHIGKPGIKAGLMEPWRAQMKELAGLPNVWCKISGVVTEADHATWTEAQVMPYVTHAIECFGFERAMFGGDWPVSELATTYKRWVDVVDAVVAKASTDEKRKLFRGTGKAFYRV